MEPKYIDAVMKLLDPRFREMEPAAGDIGCVELTVKAVDTENRRVTAVVSTNEIDRYEEIIEPKAFRKWMKYFKQNPVCLAGHDHVAWGTSEPTVIGKWLELTVTETGLEATVEFAKTPLAELYWQLYRDGFMRAFSVGFIVHAYEMREFDVDGGKATKRLRVFTEVELIEISCVAVGANRGALAKAASAIARGSDQGKKANEAVQKDFDVLAAKIEAAIEKSIVKVLTDPFGPVDAHTREVVAACLAGGSHGHGYFDHESDDRSAGGGEGKAALKQALRELVAPRN